MNCYECARPAPAVAVCHLCGAGLCRDHVRVRVEEVHRAAGPGPSRSAHGRRMLCGVCADAAVPGASGGGSSLDGGGVLDEGE
ncbi:DUF2180 family protein [Streptomyces sudanensis]|uniref:DUF2180 family protein n=1 Tax=Streptomyces sudanensis TaxID=436397 RepID=UPI0020CDF877|nr:DUF2180 family protein [Streptomyces sudanensis]MCP9956447.1 DUF2180 family protein [Streptomyces sudanensis]MCP9985651.1 DUF2180 family protein [Streptomyces sudanensis]MCQ0002941.1 DUF2180 family protein [Streptomyces sudanensis]